MKEVLCNWTSLSSSGLRNADDDTEQSFFPIKYLVLK